MKRSRNYCVECQETFNQMSRLPPNEIINICGITFQTVCFFTRCFDIQSYVREHFLYIMEPDWANLANILYTTSKPEEQVKRCVVVMDKHRAITYRHGTVHGNFTLGQETQIYPARPRTQEPIRVSRCCPLNKGRVTYRTS